MVVEESSKQDSTAQGTEVASQVAEENSRLGTYRVRLDSFEGPLDLLLHLIKKNELEIHEISINIITQQYLEYLEMMKTMNLDIAGEFLVMAATLAHIKSKSLLPEDSLPDNEVFEDEEDPKEALIRRLKEYQQFKEVGSELAERPWLGRDVFVRSEEMPQYASSELHPVNLFTLVELFYARLKKAPKVLQHEVLLERLTVAERIQQITDQLHGETRQQVDFDTLLSKTQQRHDIVVTFLALLEMVRIRMVRLVQSENFANILVQKRARL